MHTKSGHFFVSVTYVVMCVAIDLYCILVMV